MGMDISQNPEEDYARSENHDDPSGPDTPWITLMAGVVLAVLGGAALGLTSSTAGTVIGIALLGVGGIALQIGIIATAVEMALRRFEWRNDVRARI